MALMSDYDCIHYTAERVEDGTYECTACGKTLLVVVE